MKTSIVITRGINQGEIIETMQENINVPFQPDTLKVCNLFYLPDSMADPVMRRIDTNMVDTLDSCIGAIYDGLAIASEVEYPISKPIRGTQSISFHEPLEAGVFTMTLVFSAKNKNA